LGFFSFETQNQKMKRTKKMDFYFSNDKKTLNHVKNRIDQFITVSELRNIVCSFLQFKTPEGTKCLVFDSGVWKYSIVFQDYENSIIVRFVRYFGVNGEPSFGEVKKKQDFLRPVDPFFKASDYLGMGIDKFIPDLNYHYLQSILPDEKLMTMNLVESLGFSREKIWTAMFSTSNGTAEEIILFLYDL
jgi:hypothetical protein